MHLWSKEMRESKQKKRNLPFQTPAKIDRERNFGMPENQIEILREALHQSAQRPDFFWKRQRSEIMARLKEPVLVPKRQPASLWVPVALGVVLCIFFFVQSSKAPTPDFAAGSDQELLIGIERALSRDYPEAFDPAVVLNADKKKERQSGQ